MPESPYDTLVDAFHEAKKQMVEATRTVRSDIVRPLDPNATQLTRAERQADFNNFMLNPQERESEFLRLQERFNLPPNKPIPRRLVEYILKGMQESR